MRVQKTISNYNETDIQVEGDICHKNKSSGDNCSETLGTWSHARKCLGCDFQLVPENDKNSIKLLPMERKCLPIR